MILLWRMNINMASQLFGKEDIFFAPEELHVNRNQV
jgi:hypothetical protein